MTESKLVVAEGFLIMRALWCFPGGSDGKEPACNRREADLVPEPGRSPEKEVATHSRILAWRIPSTEVPCGIQSLGP